ncbi:hypothetical protein ACR4XJ_02230 [Nitratidesulfovibrio sp. D1]|uniref:hypothetical protein n=1 Tax=Nitratidesulfovibrio sp. D1 TaxID=3440151 RepID=UPI003EBA9711
MIIIAVLLQIWWQSSVGFSSGAVSERGIPFVGKENESGMEGAYSYRIRPECQTMFDAADGRKNSSEPA